MSHLQPVRAISQAQQFGEMKAQFQQLQQELSETRFQLQQALNNHNPNEARIAQLEQRIEMLIERQESLSEQTEPSVIEETEEVTIIEPPPLPEQTEPEPEPIKQTFGQRAITWLLK